MIKFKKGAFASLRSIRPQGILYESDTLPVQSGAIAFDAHIYLMGLNLYSTCTVHDFPIFKPN